MGLASAHALYMPATETQPAATASVVPTIHLQVVGQHRAKLVSEVQVGDVLVWNYGTRSLVTAMRPMSKCFVEIDETYIDRMTNLPRTWTRRMKLARLVAFSSQPWTDRG